MGWQVRRGARGRNGGEKVGYVRGEGGRGGGAGLVGGARPGGGQGSGRGGNAQVKDPRVRGDERRAGETGGVRGGGGGRASGGGDVNVHREGKGKERRFDDGGR